MKLLMLKLKFYLVYVASFLAISVGFYSHAVEVINEASFFSKSYSQFLEKKAFESGKKVFVLWDLETIAESYSSEIDNSFFFQFRSAGKLKYKIADQLEIRLKANVQFNGGQAQSRFGELIPGEAVFMNYFYLNFEPLSNNMISLKAGALAQEDVFMNNVFISRRSFPGLSESLTLGDEFKFILSAQQAIPTNFTFSTDLVEKEETPSLFSGSAGFSYDQKKEWSASLKFSVFDYNDLPSNTVQTSRLYGNTVQGEDFASLFAFDFQGWFTNFEVFYRPSKRTVFGIQWDMLENTEAPETFNQSQTISVHASHRWSKNFGFDFQIADFFIESDAVPAAYTSRTFGQTNRKGQYIEFGLEWVPKKVRFAAAYAKADLINPDESLRQLDFDVISLTLETAYDLFN